MNLERFNLSNVCRLCLRSSKHLKDIFAKARIGEQSKMDLAAKITACVSLEILPSDLGPHTICDKCLESINNWYEFNEVCHVSNALLSKYLNEPLDYSRKHQSQTSDKPNLLNESSILPEISILSHDSLLDRNFNHESNVSPIRNFCISPTPFKLDNILIASLTSCSSKYNFTNAISRSSNNLAAESNAGAKNSKSTEKKGYECEFCGLSFPRFMSLLNHDNKKHVDLQKEPCSSCGRLFVSVDRLKVHENVVHRERSFRCDSCHKMFSSKKSLSVHRRLHTGKYKCQSCGFVSTSKLYLTQHLKKHGDSDGDSSFACSICDKRFSFRSALLRHEKLHTVDKGKAFKCSICYLRFRCSSELTQHLSTHQGTVEKRFPCHICLKTFQSKKLLGMHLRRHKPAQLVCEICDKKVFSQYDLRIHRETHSDLKNFACFHCDKRFSFKNTLVRHLKKHYSRIRSDIAV